MMGRKQRLINGDEYDLIYAKKMYCYLKRARNVRRIKRKMNRRWRKQLKKELQEIVEDS